MDNTEFKIQLREKLSQLDVFNPINDRQVAIRCPFCGDSQKNEYETHFYIKIDLKNDEEPVLFNCFRASCQMSGLITPTVLRTIGINDLNLNSTLVAYNKRAVRAIQKGLGISDNSFNFAVPRPDENDDRNIRKRDYINRRLGTEMSFKEMVDLKVIFSFAQFLNTNEITKITIKKDKALLLNNDYVGFLTTRNEFINFRNTYDNANKRYEKYSVYTNLDNTRKFYTIPNQVDLLSNKKITINIAEGIFDILGIYHHVFEREPKNMIYTAVCGAGYLSVLKYFIQMGVIDNVDINIFSDENVNINYYKKKVIPDLKPWVNDINIYYNESDNLPKGKRDYGVPEHQIKIQKKRI